MKSVHRGHGRRERRDRAAAAGALEAALQDHRELRVPVGHHGVLRLPVELVGQAANHLEVGSASDTI